MTATALNGLARIPVSEIHPSPINPRERLTDLDGLARSMREVGLIQPIIVQQVPGEPGYRIIAGHCRHAAAKTIGLEHVPCIIRRDMLPDTELLNMLIENGQRAGLDPVEEGRALAKLKQQRGLTDLEVGRVIGRSQPYVSARLALLALPVEQQEEVRVHQMTITEATDRGRLASGKVRKRGGAGPQHLAIHHPLGTRAKARCVRLGHTRGSSKSVGGIACGECWESVIRADERDHLNHVSNERGRCVLCDTAQPATDPLEQSA